MKTYTARQLEAAFEFCRIAIERGGYMVNGQEGRLRLPNLPRLMNNPKDYTHLPKPPKKVMMQMWRHPTLGDVACSDGFEGYLGMPLSEKIGEPFEFVLPEGVK